MRPSRLVVSACLLTVLTACADGGEREAEDDVVAEPIAAEDGVVAVTGTDQLRWSAEEITAETGELTVELTCEDAVNHNVVVDGEKVAECAPGGTDTGSVSLDSGEHEFVCTVPGHDRTMRGTITVG